MQEVAKLKHVYDIISSDVETLKTEKRLLLERLNNIKMKCEMKKNKLDKLRRLYSRAEEECEIVQNRIADIREKNRVINEELSITEEIRFTLMNEIQVLEDDPVFDTRIDSLIEKEKRMIREYKLRIAENESMGADDAIKERERDLQDKIAAYKKQIERIGNI